MNAPQTQALATLLEREQAQRDSAAQALQQAESQLERARAQAAQLSEYRAQYIARWSAHFNRQSAIEIVHCYRSFMQRLDQALAQQEAQVARTTDAVARCRALRVDAEQRLAAVQKLIGRRVDEHRRALARHDQKQTDEAAQRSGWLASQGGGMNALFN